jgi:hypothetical protein
MYKMKIYILYACLLFSCFGNNNKKPIAVRQFYPFKSGIDTAFSDNKNLISKFEYFIISNYREGLAADSFVDSFAKKNRDVNFDKYDGYGMVFYKESKFTNEEYVAKNPRSIDRYSQDHDLVYSYDWDKKGVLYKAKYKNGVLIYPKNTITIEDIK